jgi:uncharacterized membrane protein YkoI
MKHLIIGFVFTVGFAVVLTTVSHVALSSDDERQWEDDDHAYDRARRAVELGETLPIAELLERLKTRVPGEVVGVEFERADGKWVYEFKVIDTRGRLLEIYVDARTGEILSMEKD